MEELDLSKYRGNASSAYTGRIEGQQARSELMLNDKDKDGQNYQVIIPLDTNALNPSFYLGLFYKSIKLIGLEKFNQKYSISTDEIKYKDQILRDISEAQRQAKNEIKSNGIGLLNYFKKK